MPSISRELSHLAHRFWPESDLPYCNFCMLKEPACFIYRSFEMPVTILPVDNITSNLTLSIGLLLRCITIRIPTTALNSVRINPSFDTGLTFQALDQTEGFIIYGTPKSIRISMVHCGKHCRNTYRYLASVFDRKTT